MDDPSISIQQRLWRMEMLGQFRAVRDGQVINRFRTRKTADVLAYLALSAGRSHARDLLAERFWPDVPLESARHNLRLSLSALRKQFDGENQSGSLFQTDRLAVALHPLSIATDVREFENAVHSARRRAQNASPDQREDERQEWRRAFALYRGCLLPDSVEEWAISERQRLESLYVQVVQALVLLLQDSDPVEAGNISEQAVIFAAENIDVSRAAATTFLRIGLTDRACSEARRLQRLCQQLGTDVPDEIRTLLTGSSAKRHRSPTPPPSNAASLPGSSPSEHLDEPIHTNQPIVPPALPLTLTTFFGRGNEIETIVGSLTPDSATGQRLVTLTGTGGVGKTRLAIESAQRLRQVYSGRIWFVALRPLAGVNEIGQTIAQTLHLPPISSSEISPMDQVIAHLRPLPHSLLILDNLEHLIDTNGVLQEMVEKLLCSVPNLNMLLTSRRPLEVPGEREFPLSPLPLFTRDVVESPGVALFMDRARAVRPDFALTEQNRTNITAICERLDGLPLAIELAAARIASQSPAMILRQLTNRLDLTATRPARSLDDRHRSLRTAISWSYELLSPDLQSFFVRLSLFRGGWDMAATRIAASSDWSEDEVSEALAELRRHSLIVVEDGEELRFSILETLREFARERLPQEEAEDLARTHAEHYLRFLTDLEPRLNEISIIGPNGAIERELENIRAALRFSLAPTGNPLIGIEIATRMSPFWLTRGYLLEGCDVLQAMLKILPGEQVSLRVPALIALAYLSRDRGDLVLAEASLNEAGGYLLDLSSDDWWDAQEALRQNNLAIIYLDRGEWNSAEQHIQRAITLWERRQNHWGTAISRVCAGWIEIGKRNAPAAKDHAYAALGEFRRTDNPFWIAMAHFLLANIANLNGDGECCHHHLTQSLALHRRVGSVRPVATCLRDLALLSLRRQGWSEAIDFASEARTLAEQIGDRWNFGYATLILGEAARESGDRLRAEEHYREALACFTALNRSYGIGWALKGLGLLAMTSGHLIEAKRHFEEAILRLEGYNLIKEVDEVARLLSEVS